MISYRLSGTLAALLCFAAFSSGAQPGMSQTSETENKPVKAQVGAIDSTNQNAEKATSIVKIYNHAIKGKPAATLYVRNLPILTFLKPSSASKAQLVSTDDSQNSTKLNKAEAIATQLDQMYRDGVAADGIKVVWEGNQKTRKGKFVVKADKLPIATIDRTTTYAQTTRSAEQDALLVANRLRRLLGDGSAAPLKQVEGKPKPLPKPTRRVSYGGGRVVRVLRGEASWYGPGFHGRLTANGERYNQYGLTAAHPSLRFGTRVRVTNRYTGRSVVVRINDRGPYAGGRIIDLSSGAADVIGLKSSGVAPVSVEILGR